MKHSFIKGLLALLLITGLASVYAQDEATTEDPQGVEAAEENAKENITNDGDESPVVESDSDKKDETASDDAKADDSASKSEGGNIYSDGRITYATSSAQFKLKAEDNLSTLKHIEFKIDDNTFQIYTEPFRLNNVEEGRHTITYRSVDKVGNKESDNVYAVIIDNTPPEVVVSTKEGFYQSDKQLYAKSASAFELKATDQYSGVKNIQYSLNGEEKTAYSDSVAFDKSGLQSVIYTACDNVGNVSAEQKFIAFIDDKAPEVAIQPAQSLSTINGKKYSKKENSFSVVAKDSDSGVAQILVKVDGEDSFKPYSTVINFAEEGEHKIEAKAVDNVGNESEVAVLELIVDNNPPKTMIETVSDQETEESQASESDNNTEEESSEESSSDNTEEESAEEDSSDDNTEEEAGE